MESHFKKVSLMGALLLGAPLFSATSLYAATPINLSKQQPSILQSMIVNAGLKSNPTASGLQEINRHVDLNKTLHIRSQQTYGGYKVWGAQAIVHVPNAGKMLTLAAAANNGSTMNGRVYNELNKDLGMAPTAQLRDLQSTKAMDLVIANYEHKVGNKVAAEGKESELVVYVDKANKAHWAYKVKFYVPAKTGSMPSKPVAIIDAVTQTVYKQWDEIQTLESTHEDSVVTGGGFGGNEKMGQVIYDGLKTHLFSLKVQRDGDNNCSLQNVDVKVKEYDSGRVPSYTCKVQDDEHNKVYWDDQFHKVNGGYSPDNDALFGGAVIKDMYKGWYGLDVLTQNGKPMQLVMVVHDPIDNAYWDGYKMTFGDGVDMFYPLTSLGVAAHEISHGFTQQHSDLDYYGQSGGMNEAFSDMAAQAAEYFAYGKNSWQIGPEIFKEEGQALRYMDKPSKDCPPGTKPGDWCSIDSADQYNDDIDVHYSSGVYNRLFYLMGTAKDWDTRKAFDVMVKANMDYWTSDSSFSEAACGVLQATKDLKYSDKAVKKALKTVAVDYSDCKIKK